MNNKWRVYLNPFDADGNYTSYQEITKDVLLTSLGSINTDLDNTDYDVGVYRVSNFKITLRNEHGLYSDVGTDQSIFLYKRADTLVKITWETEEDGPFCGIAITDQSYLSEEITMFIGLLNDESLTMDLSKQQLSFSVLGREAIFLRTIVPFGSINNGDTYNQCIYALLNQTAITRLLTVDPANINCAVNNTIDSIASLQNQTVQEGLNNLLLVSNSVLYVKNDTIYVAPRTETVAVAFNFNGQGSTRGPENVQDVKQIRNGLAKTFNFFTWSNTVYYAQDATSVQVYGAIKKEISAEFTTNATKIQTCLDALRTEFKDPKQEFDIYTPLNYLSLVVNLLDKVSIDYPKVYEASGHDLPICGQAICGTAILPKTLWSFSIDPTDYYKVIGKALNMKESMLKFKLRKI